MGADNATVPVLSSESKLAYSIVSVLTALCAISGNAFYLCWYIRDRKLKGCFYMFIGNLAASDFLLATVMATINVVLLYDPNVVLCAVFRLTVQWPRQEIKLILVILTFDRIQLVKGVKHYRQFITDRSAKLMVVTSWIVSVAFCVFYAIYLFVLNGDKSQYYIKKADNCHAFIAQYIDVVSILNLLMDVLLFVSYVYVLILCRQTQRIMSSIELQDRVEQTENTRLSPRDSTALNLYGVASVMSMDSYPPPTKTQFGCRNLAHISENSLERVQGEMRGAATTTISKGKGGRDTDDAAGPPSMDKDKENMVGGWNSKDTMNKKKQHSVLFDGRAICKQKLASAPGGTNNKSHVSQSQYSTAMSYRDSGEFFYPAIKSRLPRLLTKPTHINSLRSDTIAAQQLGVFLGMHFLMSTPLDVCYLVGSVMGKEVTETITVYVFWFLWLTLLRAVLFPCLYCLYSSRLRSHFSPYLCPCRCIPTRVSPSGDTLSTCKSSLDKPKRLIDNHVGLLRESSSSTLQKLPSE